MQCVLQEIYPEGPSNYPPSDSHWGETLCMSHLSEKVMSEREKERETSINILTLSTYACCVLILIEITVKEEQHNESSYFILGFFYCLLAQIIVFC